MPTFFNPATNLTSNRIPYARGGGRLGDSWLTQNAQGVLVGITADPTNSGFLIGAGHATDSAYIAVTNQGLLAGHRQLRMGFAVGSTVATLQGTRLAIADDVDVALQAGGGKVLLGTTSAGVHGLAQLASHTTAAGGYGFYDFTLYRKGAGIAGLNASLEMTGGLTAAGVTADTLSANVLLQITRMQRSGVDVVHSPYHTGFTYLTGTARNTGGDDTSSISLVQLAEKLKWVTDTLVTKGIL